MPSPIHELVRDLERELARDPRGPSVTAMLGAYAAAEDDWRDFAHYEDGCYTRNLVHGCEAFELIVICWRVDHESAIHDHQGQRCWMTVLEGHIEESLYEAPNEEGRPLKRGPVKTYAPGEVAYICDDIGLHKIRPAPGTAGVSLHLYAQPIRQCRTFCPDTGRLDTRTLSYHSVQGVPTPAGATGGTGAATRE